MKATATVNKMICEGKALLLIRIYRQNSMATGKISYWKTLSCDATLLFTTLRKTNKLSHKGTKTEDSSKH